MPTITIHDETTLGVPSNPSAPSAPPPPPLTLDLLSESLTVRELIRSRVYQEVDDFNRKQRTDAQTPFQGLVQPTDAERLLDNCMRRRTSY